MEAERILYLNSLIDYLEKGGDENYNKLEEAAKHTVSEDIQKLKEGDKTSWARLLWYLPEYMHEYKKLRELSPFKDRVLIQVHQDCMGESYHVENLEMKVWEKLRSDDFANGRDDYLLVMPFSEEIFMKAEIVWVRGDPDYPKNFNREKREMKDKGGEK